MVCRPSYTVHNFLHADVPGVVVRVYEATDKDVQRWYNRPPFRESRGWWRETWVDGALIHHSGGWSSGGGLAYQALCEIAIVDHMVTIEGDPSVHVLAGRDTWPLQRALHNDNAHVVVVAR